MRFNQSINKSIYLTNSTCSYDALVTDYWPEFGANGKEELTVADILRHEGGLTKFDTSIALEDLTTQRIKENAVGAVIEKQSLE